MTSPVDAVEHPVEGRIVRRASVVRAVHAPLRREADADEGLRRAAVAAPEPAVGAVEGLPVLAGLGRPGADAGLGAADLDRRGVLRVQRHPPVEAVAAEVEEVPAAASVARERVERLARVVLGVRAGRHRPVGGEAGDAFLVQLAIGDDVVGDALRVQPGDQVAVGLEVAQARPRWPGSENVR